MTNILEWLDGKKAIILGIASAVLSYAVASQLITAELGALLQTIISILAGGAVIASNRILGARSRN